MTFTWPWMLIALAAVPALLIGYRRILAGQARRRADLATLGLLTTTTTNRTNRTNRTKRTNRTTKSPRERARHVGPVLLGAALTLMILALARPVATVPEPQREGTVILAFDVSTSMAAKDTKNTAPTRLDDAKAAARVLVDRKPSSIRIGVVAFGDNAVVAQQPTTNKRVVLSAINRLTPQGNTAIGPGILASLGAIAGKVITAPDGTDRTTNGTPGTPGTQGPNDSTDETPIGYYGGTAIVLLTDGEDTDGSDPLEPANLASAAGVRIYPVGLGSTSGTVLQVDGFSIATALKEDTLKRIAQTTGGTYRSAADPGALTEVYDSIELTWTARTVSREVTSLVGALAALLLLAGAGLSVLRSGRVI